VPSLVEAFRAGGVGLASRLVKGYVSQLLGEVYSCLGLPFGGEVSFYGLADAGVVDEGTATYLVATYMALESLLGDLEEAGSEGEALGVLAEAERMLGELAGTLGELKRRCLSDPGQAGVLNRLR